MNGSIIFYSLNLRNKKDPNNIIRIFHNLSKSVFDWSQ